MFLALDLVAGRVGEGHPLFAWLADLLDDRSALERLRDRPAPPEVIGLNLYPLFTRKRLERDRQGRLRIRMPYTEKGLIEDVATRISSPLRRSADDFGGGHCRIGGEASQLARGFAARGQAPAR